jgi:FkbM family methyltransferase
MAAIARMSWNPRGKQKLLRMWDYYHGPTRCRSLDGFQLECLLSSSQDVAFITRNDSVDELRQLVSGLPAGGVFVDVGANIGYFSVMASHAVGNDGLVVALEPARREYCRLLHHIALNNANGVVALNCACSDRVGLARLEVHNIHTGLHRLVPSDTADGTSHSTVVVPLDALLPGIINTRTIDLLKIDVEGCEFEVLKGCGQLLSEQRIREVFVEVTDVFLRRWGHSRHDLYRWMASHGYEAVKGESELYQYDELFRLAKSRPLLG